MGKTGSQLQAEMAKRKKQAGQKKVGLWLDSDIIKRGQSLKGMTQTDTLTHAINLGLQFMELIKDQDSNLYINLVEGDLSGIQSKINDLFIQQTQSSTQPSTIKYTTGLGKKAYDLEQQGLSHGDIAKKLGKGRSTISEHIRKYKHSISN